MTATRTAHSARSFNAGQAQVILALGALFVDVRAAILPAIFPESKPPSDPSEES